MEGRTAIHQEYNETPMMGQSEVANAAMEGRFNGHHWVVAGGASGIGLATVVQLLRKGAKVTILDWAQMECSSVGDKMNAEGTAFIVNKTPFAETFGEFQEKVRFVVADCTKEDEVQKGMAQAVADLGELRGCVVTAGKAHKTPTGAKPVWEYPLEDFNYLINENLTLPFLVVKHATLAMKENTPCKEFGDERGSIVTVGSIGATSHMKNWTGHAGAKGGLHALTLVWARDCAGIGIRVNCVVPGLFHTPATAGFPAGLKGMCAKLQCNPSRMGMADECASTILHAGSNGYMNGSVVEVNAGLVFPNPPQ